MRQESAVPLIDIAIKLKSLRPLHPLRIRTHLVQIVRFDPYFRDINDEIRAKHA